MFLTVTSVLNGEEKRCVINSDYITVMTVWKEGPGTLITWDNGEQLPIKECLDLMRLTVGSVTPDYDRHR